MMRHDKILAGAAALTLALSSVIVVPPTAQADSGVSCNSDRCSGVDIAPGSDAGGTAQNNDNSAERKPTQQIVVTPEVPLEEQTCASRDGKDIPCTRENDGKSEWYYAPGDCYAGQAEQKLEDGSGVFHCAPASDSSRGGHAGAVVISPEDQARYNRAAKSGYQVAREAIAAHHFDRFTIASLPKDPSDPLYTKAHLWLWVPANTDARAALNTPLVEEKSDGPTHVRMTFKPVGVNINVTGPRSAHLQCKSLGKAAAADQHLQQPSPSCSYQPRVQGRYHLEGEVLWQVSWQAGDQSGEIVHAVPFEGKDIVVTDAAARNVAP